MGAVPSLARLSIRIPLVLLGMIFVVEALIMTVFAITRAGEHRWLEVILDSSVLTITVAPLFYWLIVRPLRVLADERSQLLAHMFEIQDAERRRIARDLHDEIGQSFTSLLVRLRLLEEAATLEAVHSQAAELRQLGGQVYDQVRNLARGLHPSILDDLGLVAAVKRLAEDFELTHGIACTVQVAGDWQARLDLKVKTAAYRVIQESLTNCAKYAQASAVDITLARRVGELTVTIADNGRGFDLGGRLHAANSPAFGLMNMRERALLLNGSLRVQSRPAGGTTVTLRLPVSDLTKATQ